MRKIIGICIVLLVLTTVTFLGIEIFQKQEKKKQMEITTQQLPEFSFKTLTQSTFTNQNLISEKKVLFVFFNPSCEYCQLEAKEFAHKNEQFRNIQILFISGENRNEIENFSMDYQLNNKTNIIFLQDENETFYKIFNVNTIPYMVLYDSTGKKINSYSGSVNIDKISNDAG